MLPAQRFCHLILLLIAKRHALAPDAFQHDQEYKDHRSGTERQREVAQLQRSKAEKVTCGGPEKRQAQQGGDRKQHPDQHRIWPTDGFHE